MNSAKVRIRMSVGNNWTRSLKFTMTNEEALNHLLTNYSNPSHPISFMGIGQIFNYYNGNLSKRRIRNILSNQESYTLMKQEKKNPRKLWTPVISFHYLDLGKDNK